MKVTESIACYIVLHPYLTFTFFICILILLFFKRLDFSWIPKGGLTASLQKDSNLIGQPEKPIGKVEAYGLPTDK